MKPIGIACRLDKENALDLAGKIIDYLMKKDAKLVLENRIAQRFQRFLPKKDLRQMNKSQIKAIISVGGDGTILRVAQNLPRKNPAPILGVNLGDSVGFLDECDLGSDKLYDTLDKLINDEFSTERVMRLASYHRQNRFPDALNEIYIVSAKPSKVLRVNIKVDGEFYSMAHVDGLIISTTVGSTAYSLSAGGALVDPRLDLIQIVPVNPFARTTVRPIIVPNSSQIEVELVRPKLNALIVIDGQHDYRIYPKSKILIQKSDSDIEFIRFNPNLQENFYDKLQRKILVGLNSSIIEDSPEE
ncbi:MAG: NAD(+)/NADH kinase [Candidatus Lokiarchaeota archaeon]|nr:NAD(+)/NADH kinase [Candidatus Lokiarchaeota archaeon]